MRQAGDVQRTHKPLRALLHPANRPGQRPYQYDHSHRPSPNPAETVAQEAKPTVMAEDHGIGMDPPAGPTPSRLSRREHGEAPAAENRWGFWNDQTGPLRMTRTKPLQVLADGARVTAIAPSRAAGTANGSWSGAFQMLQGYS